MTSLLTRLLARRRWLLGVLSLLAVLAGARTVRTYAALKSDLEELLPERAPSVTSLSVARERLPGLRHLGVVVDTGGPQNGAAAGRFLDDLRARVLAYDKDMVGSARSGVSEERRFLETYALQLMDPKDVRELRVAVEKRRDWEVTHGMDLDLLDESEDPPPPIPVAKLREKYEGRHGSARRFKGDRFVSEDGGTAVLVIQASSNATSYEADNALLSRVKRDVEKLGFPDSYAPGMRVGYAGDVPTRVEEMDGLVVDLGISGALVTLLVVFVVVLFYRSWRALPVLGVPLLFGTLYTFGLVALPPLSIRHLNSNTAFLGSIVVGNGINSGIILLARFVEERRAGRPLEASISAAVSGTWRPTLAAALAASTAYGSLVFTNFRGFNQFGWIGAVGMITCWLTTYSCGPALLQMLGAPLALREAEQRPGLLRRAITAVVARPRAVLGVSAALIALSALGLARRGDWIEYDFSKLRRRDSWQSGERYWGKRMDATLQRYLTPTVVMADTPEQAAEVAKRVRRLRDSGGAGGLISSVRVASDVLRSDRADSIDEAKRLKALLTPRMKSELKPDERQLLERALSDRSLVPLEPRDLPHVLVAGLRDNQGRVDRNVLVFPALSPGTWDGQRMQDFTRDLRQASTLEGRTLPIAGSLLLSSDITTAMKHDGPRATVYGLFAALLICVVAFRSLGLSLAAMTSLFAGVGMMLGAMAWAQMKLNFSNFVVLPITFGISADYSINMLKRYQSDGRFDLRAALSSTGGAVALCSATTIIGFGSLLVAQNQALFSFGVFAVAGEVFPLLTAILALPAALTLFEARRATSLASAAK